MTPKYTRPDIGSNVTWVKFTDELDVEKDATIGFIIVWDEAWDEDEDDGSDDVMDAASVNLMVHVVMNMINIMVVDIMILDDDVLNMDGILVMLELS